MIAAIIGGGLKAFGIEIPVLQSLRRQLALGLFGAILVGISFLASIPPNTSVPANATPQQQQSALKTLPHDEPPNQASQTAPTITSELLPPKEVRPSEVSFAGYWSGPPVGIPIPTVFHFVQNGAQVTGTMQSPCQSPYAAPIDSASVDGGRLTVVVSHLGSDPQGNAFPSVTMNVTLKNGQLDGSFTQSSFDRHVTLNRGEETCPQ